MRKLYRAILSLYPTEYRSIFAQEMVEVFDHAAMAAEKQGLLSLLRFAACEFAGLLNGLFSERVTRWRDRERYITSRCLSRPDTGFPLEIADLQSRLEHLLRSMEFAIAHHDFPGARYYSNEERGTRAHLQRLISERKIDNRLTRSNDSPRLLAARMERDFDVVLYGAPGSGFTGRQTVQYFSQWAPRDIRWAIAGRDRQKLES